MRPTETCLELLLDNFQLNFGQLSESAKTRLITHQTQIWLRYILDFFISSFIIAPCVISFWRGVWDYSLIYLHERYFEEDCIKTNLTCLAIGKYKNHEKIREIIVDFLKGELVYF